MKTCTACQVIKPLDRFSKRASMPDGLQLQCKTCCAEGLASWRARNLERKRQMDRDYAAANRESARIKTQAWVKADPARKQRADRMYRIANLPQIREKHSMYKKANRATYNAAGSKRRAVLRKAMPAWANLDKIEAIYRLAKILETFDGQKYHVDHVVPLQGELVCGLHCEANLQILPAAVNSGKRNFFTPG